MNKDRLNLCRSFTTAKTIAQEQKDKKIKDKAIERAKKEMAYEIAKNLEAVLCVYRYSKKPWYKKIFD